MQSVDEFTPSTTEPVFGSGLVSQTKSQTSTNNDNEKVAEPVVNGQNDTTVNKITSNENITNGTTENVDENIGAGDSSAVHVNGQNENPMVEVNPAEESTPTEKPSQVEPTVSSTEPEPVLPTPVDTIHEGSSSVSTTSVDTAPPPAVVDTTTDNANVPEVPIATESETAEYKSKSPRGRAKPPVVSTTPTRQSSRGRKTASSSSTNVEENQTIDDTSAPTNQIEALQLQPNSTTGDTIADDNITEGEIEKASPSGRQKRGASTSGTTAAKKAKGQNSITPTDDVDSEAIVNEGEIIQTPPKKARTSANKKTPEPPSEEYVRKLRPRK